jgi:hypothetical protein
MADDKKDNGFNPFKWAIEHPEWLLIGWYALKGAISGHVDDDAPDEAKRMAKGAGASVGGKNRPEDEAAYRRVKNKIGTDVNRITLMETLDGIVNGVFDLGHKVEWRRTQGEDSFEHWRMQIAQAAKDNLDDAVLYLTRLAETGFHIFKEECKKRGETPLSIKGNKRAETHAWRATCKAMREKMRSDAVPLPKGIKPYGVHLKEAVLKTGPKVVKEQIPAGWNKAKDWWISDEFIAKRKAAQERVVNSSKSTIKQAKETATKIDTKVTDHVDKMETMKRERGTIKRFLIRAFL